MITYYSGKIKTLDEAILDNLGYYNLLFDSLVNMKELRIFGVREDRTWDAPYEKIERVCSAYSDLFFAYSNRKEEHKTLKYMNRELSQRSNGLVSLKPLDFTNERFVVRGPSALFNLVKGDTVKKMLFTPNVAPFTFWNYTKK